MKIKHFYLDLSSEFDSNEIKIRSDFRFQSDFITHYIEKGLKSLKFESHEFNMILIKGQKHQKTTINIDPLFKTLTINVLFNIEKYKTLYPYTNIYPLDGNLINPIRKEKAFNEFLLSMILDGMESAKIQNITIPYDSIIESAMLLESLGFINQWTHKKKRFKDHKLIVELNCKLTSNYFILTLIIEKRNQPLYQKEILKTLPNAIMYKNEFDTIDLINECVVITKKDRSILFELDINEITVANIK